MAVHGVEPGEREAAQPFELDLDLEGSFAAAIATDQLVDTVDYGQVIGLAVSVVQGTSFQLLETLAAAVATRLLGEPGVEVSTVTVRKLRPPLPFDVASVGVTLTRERRR